MKVLLLAFAFIGFNALAATYDLSDSAILGKYALHRANKKSDIQWAEVRYNNDNQLVVTTDRDDNEYDLTGPKKDGLVYAGEDEPNCDGDESSCDYDAETKIWLNKVGGAPQLTIDITVVDSFNEKDKGETTEYVLDWDKELPDAVPYYSNIKLPKTVQSLLQTCAKAVKPTVGYGGMGADSEICGNADAMKYRDTLEKALSAYSKAYNAKLQEVTNRKLQTIFETENDHIKTFRDGELKISKSELLKQAKIIQDYIADHSDRIFYFQYVNTAYLLSVNESAKIIVAYHLETTYKN